MESCLLSKQDMVKGQSDLNRKINADKCEDQVKKEAGFPLQVYHLKVFLFHERENSYSKFQIVCQLELK